MVKLEVMVAVADKQLQEAMSPAVASRTEFQGVWAEAGCWADRQFQEATQVEEEHIYVVPGGSGGGGSF